MSTSGLTQNYQPNTLDGLNVIEADQIYLDGQLVNLDNFVPYIGATQVLNMGAFAIQTSHIPSSGNDVVNYTTLVNAISNQDTTNFTTFLDKITNTAQTVQATTTFLNGLSVSDERTTNLSSMVIVDANYQTLITSADVSVGQYFGTISNAGGVYQATSTANPTPILLLLPITLGKRYRLMIETLIQDPVDDWTIDIYQSDNGVGPYPNYNEGILDSFIFGPSSTLFHQTDTSFVATTNGFVVLTLASSNPSALIATVEWKNLTVYEMGVALENVSMPSQLADRVVVLNDKKQLVASGINTTKLGFLDNCSSDIQTQLNGKLNLSGGTMTGTLDMGANKVTTTYTPVNGEDLITKTYADATYLSSGAGYLPLTGGTLTGNLSSTAGTLVNFGEALKTVATDKGYTGASFTVSTAEVPAGVQTGTLSGTYRLTALSGYGSMAMAIANLNATYQFNEYYTFTFTNIAGSVPLTLTVYQNTTPRVALNITTSPQTLTTTFTTGMGSGKIYFNFQALSANPYVDWTGFTMTRTDTQMNGNVGIGTTANAQLHLSNTVGNRKIVLFDGGNDHEYYGFGINSYTLRYQVSGPLAKHIFYAGASSSASTELMRIQGNGNVGIGTTDAQTSLHVHKNNAYASRAANPLPSNIIASSASQRLYMGSYYTGGAGACATIQSSDYYSGADHGAPLLLNPLGGYVGIGGDPSAPLTVNGSITIKNGTNVYEAGCIYTDANWGMLFRGAVNASIAHMRWDRWDGTTLMKIQNTGVLSFTGGGTNYAVENGQTTRQGAVVIGNINTSYGGGWQAGLMMECQDTTEISCHDSGNRLTSFMYYDGANRLYLGRDIGWGGTPVIAPTSFTTPYVSYSGTSDCAIYNGNIDTYNPTGNNNLMIKSWWGIGFPSYDGGVRIAMDTRSGASYFGGQMTLQGTPLVNRIYKVIPVIEVNGNWNGVVRSYQFRLDVACEVRFHGYCTFYASSVGYGNAYLRLYNYDTGQLWYLFMGKFFNINFNHETIGVERYEYLPVGWYQVYVYPDYNCNIDSNDQIFVSGIAYQ